VIQVIIWIVAPVLGFADHASDVLNWKGLCINLQLFVELLEDAELIIGVAYSKTRSVSDQTCMPAEKAGAERVKGADKGCFAAALECVFNPTPHFISRLIGKRDC
jgi:hypothetical protein